MRLQVYLPVVVYVLDIVAISRPELASITFQSHGTVGSEALARSVMVPGKCRGRFVTRTYDPACSSRLDRGARLDMEHAGVQVDLTEGVACSGHGEVPGRGTGIV